MELKVSQIRREIKKQMLATRSNKYSAFLGQLKFFKIVSFNSTRARFLENYYVLMRYVDDIVDGDLLLPEPFQTEHDYIRDLLGFISNGGAQDNPAKVLYTHCAALAKEIELSFANETAEILESLLFDANRRNKLKIYNQEVLEDHFYKLDILGTIKGTAKLLNEDPNRFLSIYPLGKAVRFQYDIEDVKSDIAAGYVNISMEECEHFKIDVADLKTFNYKKILKWKKYRADLGLRLLTEHRTMMNNNSFRFITKLAFKFVYELPARKRFKQVLKEKLETD